VNKRLRSWIVAVLEQHRPLLGIAVRQCAKLLEYVCQENNQHGFASGVK
jgi:hypothetical protein